jgi:hypothetical protein
MYVLCQVQVIPDVCKSLSAVLCIALLLYQPRQEGGKKRKEKGKKSGFSFGRPVPVPYEL